MTTPRSPEHTPVDPTEIDAHLQSLFPQSDLSDAPKSVITTVGVNLVPASEAKPQTDYATQYPEYYAQFLAPPTPLAEAPEEDSQPDLSDLKAEVPEIANPELYDKVALGGLRMGFERWRRRRVAEKLTGARREDAFYRSLATRALMGAEIELVDVDEDVEGRTGNKGFVRVRGGAEKRAIPARGRRQRRAEKEVLGYTTRIIKKDKPGKADKLIQAHDDADITEWARRELEKSETIRKNRTTPDLSDRLAVVERRKQEPRQWLYEQGQIYLQELERASAETDPNEAARIREAAKEQYDTARELYEKSEDRIADSVAIRHTREISGRQKRLIATRSGQIRRVQKATVKGPAAKRRQRNIQKLEQRAEKAQQREAKLEQKVARKQQRAEKRASESED